MKILQITNEIYDYSNDGVVVCNYNDVNGNMISGIAIENKHKYPELQEVEVIVDSYEEIVKINKQLSAGIIASRIVINEKVSAGTISDEQLQSIVDLYPEWIDGEKFELDKNNQVPVIFRKYNDKLYRLIQPHTTQSDWTPDLTPALWRDTTPAIIIAVFVQPTGAHDAYQKGDRVYFPTANDKVYESLIDANVWSPTGYPEGWKLI